MGAEQSAVQERSKQYTVAESKVNNEVVARLADESPTNDLWTAPIPTSPRSHTTGSKEITVTVCRADETATLPYHATLDDVYKSGLELQMKGLASMKAKNDKITVDCPHQSTQREINITYDVDFVRTGSGSGVAVVTTTAEMKRLKK